MLASEPNGYGWKNEINKLIIKRELFRKMNDLDINFPLDKFEKLIIDMAGILGWLVQFWKNKNIISIDQYWNNKVNDDWIWGLALPLLSQAYKYQNNFSDRSIGISALPGTGKVY